MIYRALSILLMGSMSLAVVAQQKEMIALAGSGVDKIAIIEKASGRQVFAYALPHGTECNTIAVTGKGDVLFSYKQGVKLIDKKGRTIWDFAVVAGQEAQTARLIEDGKVLVGICASPMMRLVELSSRGKVVSEVNYNTGIEVPHSQFRQVNKTASGSYLVPLISAAKVVEISAKGEKIGEWKVPGIPFSVNEIDSDRILVGTMGAVVEISRSGARPLKFIARGAIGSTSDTLRFGTEVSPTPKAGVMISNWQGYAPQSDDSQLVELDSLGKVIYTFRDTAIMRHVSGFYMFRK